MSSHLSPNVYLSQLCVYPMHGTVWKNWRPLVTLLQLSDGSVAEFIDIFKKISGRYYRLFGAFFWVFRL